MQAEFGARGKHAVRLVGAFGNEVVDQDRRIRFGAIQDEWRLTLYFQGSIDARDNSLAGGLLISAGAINLASEKDPFDLLLLKRAFKFGGIDRIVFNGVAGAKHLRVLEARNGFDDGELHVNWKRGAHTVDVNLVCVHAFRLEEELVRMLVGKFNDLVFDRRTVSRADRVNLAAVHRGTMDVLANDAMSLFRREGDVARDLRIVMCDAFGTETERRGIGIARLNLEHRPIDGAAVAQTNTITASACRAGMLPARYFVDNQVRNFGLLDLEICLRFQHLAHLQTIGLLVALGTWRPNGGPAGSVEQAKLDADGIRDFAHDAAERVYFADKMSFGNTSNGGVARHLCDEINVEGIKGGLQPHPRRGQ